MAVLLASCLTEWGVLVGGILERGSGEAGGWVPQEKGGLDGDGEI